MSLKKKCRDVDRLPDLEVLVAGGDLYGVVDGEVEVSRGAHHQRVGHHQHDVLRTYRTQ